MQQSLIDNATAFRAADSTLPVVGEITLSADVSVHFLEREGILFDAAAQRLYAANTSATFIWCCLEEGLAERQVIHRLQAAFGISREDAGAYLNAAILNWRELGLVSLAGDKLRPANLPADDQDHVGEPFSVGKSVVAQFELIAAAPTASSSLLTTGCKHSN